jgi:hypothetical protein
MQIVRGESSVISHQSSKNVGDEFLKATISERFKMIEPMVKAKVDDKSAAKESAREFLDSLEQALCGELRRVTPANPRYASSLEHVLSAKRTLSERSPSLKLLLEHLVLTVPSLGNKD